MSNVWVNINGTWKSVYTYAWELGSWGACSTTCGGGTQVRTVSCKRVDGVTIADTVCTSILGPKPPTTQTCNTQSCETCEFNHECITYPPCTNGERCSADPSWYGDTSIMRSGVAVWTSVMIPSSGGALYKGTRKQHNFKGVKICSSECSYCDDMTVACCQYNGNQYCPKTKQIACTEYRNDSLAPWYPKAAIYTICRT